MCVVGSIICFRWSLLPTATRVPFAAAAKHVQLTPCVLLQWTCTASPGWQQCAQQCLSRSYIVMVYHVPVHHASHESMRLGQRSFRADCVVQCQVQSVCGHVLCGRAHMLLWARLWAPAPAACRRRSFLQAREVGAGLLLLAPFSVLMQQAGISAGLLCVVDVDAARWRSGTLNLACAVFWRLVLSLHATDVCVQVGALRRVGDSG